MSAVWLLLRKDLTVLRRSPLLLGALLAYPVVIALLVGLVAGYASSKPRGTSGSSRSATVSG